MPDEKPAANEQPQGDDINAMIADGLKARDLEQERREQVEGKTKPSGDEAPTETETDTAAGPEGTESEDETEESRDDAPNLESVLEENRKLKEKLGKQGNQVGSLKDSLAELGAALDSMRSGNGSSESRTPDPLEAEMARLTDKYGEEFAKDIMSAALATSSDLRTDRLLSGYRKKYDDFDTLQSEMADVLNEGGPELQQAVRQKPALLDIVYRAAKEKKLRVDLSTAEQRGAAREQNRAAQLKEADAERPNAAHDKAPPPFDPKKDGQKVLDGILAATEDGRKRPR